MPSHYSNIQELLNSNPVLLQYLPLFRDSGYDDLDFILTLSSKQLDDMIHSITVSGERLGIYIKHGHAIQIINKLQNEKNNRNNNNTTQQLHSSHTTNNIQQQTTIQPAVVQPPPVYNNTQQQSSLPSIVTTQPTLQELATEHERRRKLKQLQRMKNINPAIKTLPIEININKPIYYSNNNNEYITLELSDQYEIYHSKGYSCYSIITLHYAIWALLFLILLIVGIVLSITQSHNNNQQQSSTSNTSYGIGTACIMFSCCCFILSIIQYKRRFIHPNQLLDNMSCCIYCNNEIDSLCSTSSCGVCSYSSIDTYCIQPIKNCFSHIKNTFTDIKDTMKECSSSIKSCCILFISFTWLTELCNCNKPVLDDCCPTLDTTDICNDCISCNCMSGCSNILQCTGPNSICSELGCSECSLDNCQSCCDDIECNNLCNCDCLPDFTGNTKGCFNTCIKLVCCQCKIQIA